MSEACTDGELHKSTLPLLKTKKTSLRFMQSAALQLEQRNSEKDALVDQVLFFIYTLSWLSITDVLYKRQQSM